MSAGLSRRFLPALLAIVAAGALLRGVWLRADPPWNPTVGVVWHDEGAWVHNARNKALFGAWRLDEWNPVFVAPVFTALEYASFEAFGVGTWQARLVSAAAGVASIVLLGLGMRRVGGPLAGLIAAALVATNFDYVMYNRAAIMEALMVALIVTAWWASTRGEERPPWAAAAGVCAVAAYFTKASAAFYVAALGIAALWAVARPRSEAERRAAIWTLAGLGAAFGVAFAAFVVPHWADYRFYNWQISVTRKPSYDLHSFLTRASWLPILHDVLTRMWCVVAIGIFGAWTVLLRWKKAATGERLLLLWLAVGMTEMIVHDVGNERRFVILIPVFAALAGLVLARGAGLLPPEARSIEPRRAWLAAPLVLYSAYVVCGPLGRLAFLHEVEGEARLSGVLALGLGLVILLVWRRARVWLSSGTWSPRLAAWLTAALAAAAVVPFAQWSAARTYQNYEASVALGRVLPPGHARPGEARQRPVAREPHPPDLHRTRLRQLRRPEVARDVRYILTYTSPEPGLREAGNPASATCSTPIRAVTSS